MRFQVFIFLGYFRYFYCSISFSSVFIVHRLDFLTEGSRNGDLTVDFTSLDEFRVDVEAAGGDITLHLNLARYADVQDVEDNLACSFIKKILNCYYS